MGVKNCWGNGGERQPGPPLPGLSLMRATKKRARQMANAHGDFISADSDEPPDELSGDGGIKKAAIHHRITA
jgi:hypothetical protein